RIDQPLKLVAERIDGTDRRFAPGDELSRPCLGARWVDELGGLPREARRAGQGFGPRLHFAGDLRSPLRAVRCDLEGHPRALHAPNLSALSEQTGDESGKTSNLAAENAGKHLRLALVGAFVNEDASGALGLARPKIAFPSPHSDEAQTVKFDVAVMAVLNV